MKIIICAIIIGVGGSNLFANVAMIEQIKSGLVAHYSFDQDWTDDSGNQRHLISSDNANIKNGGRFGWDPNTASYRSSGSADFSSSTSARASYENTNAPAQNLTGFTFASWIKISNFNRISPNEWSYLISGDYYNSLQVRVSVAPDYNRNFWILAWPHANGFSSFDGSSGKPNMIEDEWNHVAITHNASSQITEFFFNGEKEVELANGAPAHLDVNYFILGNYYYAQYNSGEMDDVRLYDRPLTSTEVTYLAVPEPSALSLLAVGLGVVLRRRRRTV